MTHEVEINSIHQDKTIEQKFMNDLLSLSIDEINNIPEVNFTSEGDFNKTLELDLALSTSHTFKDVKNKTNLKEESIIAFMKRKPSQDLSSAEVLYDDKAINSKETITSLTTQESNGAKFEPFNLNNNVDPKELVGNLAGGQAKTETQNVKKESGLKK